MRWFTGLIAAAALVITSAQANALTIEVPLTAKWVQENPKEFSITAKQRDDGLVHFKVTRFLSEPRYLVGHFKVAIDAKTAVESHSPAFVRERKAEYYLVVSPQHLKRATFNLGEHGFNLLDKHPVPWVGGKIYQIHLADFAPKPPKE